MNSEELEQSLRSEFDIHLKKHLAGLKQEVDDFQKSFEAEFEKHKTNVEEALRKLSARFDSDVDFDQPFIESVTEHLRLARDEGAMITANAFTEAEKLVSETTQPAKYDELRDAIKDISSKTSQSDILQAFIEHAAKFTPRGAFFIVKNEQFMGWRAFGKEVSVDENNVQNIRFASDSRTILKEAVEHLTVQRASFGDNADDSLFLDSLEFGHPDKMFAMPLIARGRGVAVLYADHGNEGGMVNVEALETLVNVAGITVELQAATQNAGNISAPVADAHPVESTVATDETETFGNEREAAVTDFAHEQVEPVAVEEYISEVSPDEELPEVPKPESSGFEYNSSAGGGIETDFESFAKPADEPVSESDFAIAEHSVETHDIPNVEVAEESYEIVGADELPTVEDSASFEMTHGDTESQGNVSPAVEAVNEPEFAGTAAAAPPRSRFGDRNVDLPIDVADDERRFHNDARRFARLLVSEIKLYNGQKVTEGREANDLYDRLREAIDRSREMYDKRVQSEVAAKFDYFHYEMVNSLADGEEARLGASYPGSNN